MSYETLVLGFEDIMARLTTASSTLQSLQAYSPQGHGASYQNSIANALRPLVEFVNQPEFIQFLHEMQKYTTTPSWFVLLKDFLIRNPTFKDRIIRDYHSLGLSPEFTDSLLYSSGRPRVDFKPYLASLNLEPRFRTIEPYEYVLQPSTVLPLTVADPPDGLLLNVYVPVNRYQVGMSGYLTISSSESRKQSWCGTFYYYEPQSPFLLHAPRTLVSWNKITACLDLGIDFNNVYEILYDYKKDWMVSDLNDNKVEGYPNNMGFQVEGSTKEEQWMNVVRLYQTRALDPTKHLLDMYAAEDGFDQLLCQKARDNQIDLIILKYMTGRTRVVTEILDTRDRKTSFENIIFPPIPT